MKKHNFSAGPSILAREVIEKTAQAVLNFNESGLSSLEISHRSKDFEAVIEEAFVKVFNESSIKKDNEVNEFYEKMIEYKKIYNDEVSILEQPK